MPDCKFIGDNFGTVDKSIQFHNCNSKDQKVPFCVKTKSEFDRLIDSEANVCETCPLHQTGRKKAKFAYYTASNQASTLPMIETMIKSARSVGVKEDFFVFNPGRTVIDQTNFIKIPEGQHWDAHMAKIEFLKDLKKKDYDYFVWLDSDNYFVRDPGNLEELIRGNKCWVSMESDLTSSNRQHAEWYGMFFNSDEKNRKPGDITSPTIFEIYRMLDAKAFYLTNGGMFIVRREAIDEFYNLAFFVFHTVHNLGFHRVPDEPCLAMVASILVPDIENNVWEKHKNIWSSDWSGVWSNELPDGGDWVAREWLTGNNLGPQNPAIVHLMRSKHLMGGLAPFIPKIIHPEPVGDELHTILEECGIKVSETCGCKFMQEQMNVWGIKGCRTNKPAIVQHLKKAAKEASWLTWAKVAKKGYISKEHLINTALKRTVDKVAAKKRHLGKTPS